MLRNHSHRGGYACFGEVAWARVPGEQFEVNWLELFWLGKTENIEEHLGGDEHGVRKFRTIRRQPESARWRAEFVDKLTGDPFNPKSKSATVIGCSNLPVDLQWSERASPNVNIDDAPGTRCPNQWPHKNAGTWLWSMSTVEQWAARNRHTHRRMPWTNRRNPAAAKPCEAESRRRGTKSVPMESEKPTGPATQFGGSGSGGSAKRCHQYWDEASR